MLEQLEQDESSQAEDVNLLPEEQYIKTDTHCIDSKKLYQDILQNSLNKTKIVILVSLVVPLLTSTRYFIFELYAESISSVAPSTVSTVISLGNIAYIFTSLILPPLGDTYGHDYILLVVFIFECVGLFIEFIAQNMLILTIGFMISRVTTISVTMSYIAFILPQKQAIQYTARYYTISALIYLIGPLITGLIVEFLEYRYVFFINFIIVALCIIIILFTIIGSQKTLQQKQKEIDILFVKTQNEEEIFPICDSGNNANISWKTLIYDTDKIQLKLLIIAIIQNCICWLIEYFMILYFASFMMKQFPNISLIYIAGIMVLFTLCFGISTIVIPKCIENIIPNKIYIVSINASILVSVYIYIVYYNITYSHSLIFYWIIVPLIGIPFGIICIGTEMCQLQMQPKQHSGKVNGFKLAFKSFIRAIGVLIFGFFWHGPFFNALWIATACCALTVFLLSFLVIWYSLKL